MPGPNITITLIGSRLAKTGTAFIYRGPQPECENCKLKTVCLNLEKGKKYQVVALRSGSEHECNLHDTSVRAVEVSPCPIVVAIESRKAFNGSKLTYEELECEKTCRSYDACHPAGLVSGEKYTIAEVYDEAPGPCEKGLILKKVLLK
ncbi:MAG TPA: UPF0179 family protein [Methanocella sp.]|uniref:UPF0179 family protein n=1 Tax=Methanocella sp. TaxID=2052833 RepID=UPI002B54BD41|nr:UPF0179 family protein [Methanocella sp.]HTY91373.1 UPF0179 family protein [Methanocella sp.]